MERKYLGELIDNGVINIAIGFPCGAHNDSGEGVPHIRPFNLGTNGNISLEQIKFIPVEISEGKPTLHNGDILFNNTNSKELVGKCAVWNNDEPYVFSNHMTKISIKNKDKCNSNYLCYSILHHWMTGKSMMLARAHVAQASIIGERFKEIEVAWHSPLEQDKIAQALRIIQLTSTANERELSGWSSLKHATMHKLFTCGLRREAQKETEIGLVPESWEVEELSAHHSVVSGGTPSRSQNEYWDGGTIPWVKTTEIAYCTIYQTEEYISGLGLAHSAAKILPEGTLLLAMYGQGVTRGKVALLGIEAACNQACAAIRPLDDIILTKYLYHFLTYRYDAIRVLAHGGQQQNLNLDIAFPQHTSEQQEIVDILDAIDRKIDLHRRKKAVLEELFKSLLHKLMTGEIRVDELNLSALEVPQQSGGAA